MGLPKLLGATAQGQGEVKAVFFPHSVRSLRHHRPMQDSFCRASAKFASRDGPSWHNKSPCRGANPTGEAIERDRTGRRLGGATQRRVRRLCAAASPSIGTTRRSRRRRRGAAPGGSPTHPGARGIAASRPRRVIRGIDAKRADPVLDVKGVAEPWLGMAAEAELGRLGVERLVSRRIVLEPPPEPLRQLLREV